MSDFPHTSQFNFTDKHGENVSVRQLLFTKEFAAAYWDVFGYIMTLVGNRHDADDVMQDVAVVLWEKFDDFEHGTSFRNWAQAIAFRVARAYGRDKSKRTGKAIDDDALIAVAKSQSRARELIELRQSYLEKCLDKLKSDDRKFLLHCESRHGNVANLAREMKESVQDLHYRVRKLRHLVAKCIQHAMSTGGEA
ncbi:sigma-70 family RNA polymerase sigma factor [Calycomorphotria hydatis]|uniref:RNA polymerase sigma factor n=1 Tax=Calycomorphotria hydatis TaxID=2528027 RepID=A0A517TDJ6_9PLAN|nr:sigma-70 family RNA polymerase sigma factor [Calycomorphotria hydatis]QDT66439.1 RNA polymerase sigma factor [Calycomorphotria hydatis]